MRTANLTWNAPADSTVASYNVYVAPAGGAYALAGSSTTPSYSLPVEEGQTYLFKVTAVNPAGESAASNEVQIVVPFRIPGAPTNLAVEIV